MADGASAEALGELLGSIGAVPLDPTTAVKTGEARIAKHVGRLDEEVEKAKVRCCRYMSS